MKTKHRIRFSQGPVTVVAFITFICALIALAGPQNLGAAWHTYGDRYAIIVMGGNEASSGQKYRWFWGDTKGMYHELISYGFTGANIYFLSYGDSANAHPGWVDAQSTTANIRTAYQWAQTNCTGTDLLYVYWVDHGKPTYFNTNDGTLTHAELDTLMRPIGAKIIIGAYNPCYSGAVIDDISHDGVISITSQDASNKNAWGWAGKWRQALRGAPADRIDTDGDGHISMTEAYNWIAPQSQAAGEHSMFDDNGDSVGHEWGQVGYNPSNPCQGNDGYIGKFFSLDGYYDYPYVVCPDGSGHYSTIQDAINSLGAGDIIELADGAFTGSGNRSISYGGKALTVRSKSGNPEACIINCQSLDRGFRFISGEGAGSVLQGVTIKNGDPGYLSGGGILCNNNSSPTIRNCIFRGCSAGYGGAVSCYGGCSPTLTNCTLYGNSADYYGGGMHFWGSTNAQVKNTIIAFNTKEAVSCSDPNTPPTLACCDVYGNSGGQGCVASQIGSSGNFSSDPLFCDAGNADFHLYQISPCASGNSPPGCQLIGALGVACYWPYFTNTVLDQSHNVNGHYSTDNFTVVDDDGTIQSVTAAFTGAGVANVTVVLNPTAASKTGHIEYDVTNHCLAGGFVIISASDNGGATVADTFNITLTNNAPQVTCPGNTSVHAGDKLVSTDFSVSDQDGDTAPITFLDISPSAANSPSIVGDHVEWVTTCNEAGNTHTIRLLATDVCNAKDTCSFQVQVTNQPPQLSCPADDSINAGDLFSSTNFSVTDPDDAIGVTVTLLSISPTPANPPSIVGTRVDWLTRCADLVTGPIFTVTLVATDPCQAKDTCSFKVTVYNLPPEITCPDDDSVHAGDKFVSTDFSVTDPKAEPVTVDLCGITPTPTNQPSIVQSHVEWQTACADAGKVFSICLVATDSCGATDTCRLQVTVYNHTPQCICTDPCSVEVHKEDAVFQFYAFDRDSNVNLTCQLQTVGQTPFNAPVVTITDDQPGYLAGFITWTPNCIVDKSIWYHFELKVADECQARDTCHFYAHCYNQPPWVICPPNDTIHADHETYIGNFTYGDPENDHVTMRVDIQPHPPTSDHPVVDYANGTGAVVWTPNCEDIGTTYTLFLTAIDQCLDSSSCDWVLTVTNEPPFFTSVPASGETLHAEHSRVYSFTADDPEGDPICSMDISATLGSISDVIPVIPPCQASPVTVLFTYTAPSVEQLTNFYICFIVDDTCEAAAETCLTLHIKPLPRVVIPSTDSCVNPGEYVCLPIVLRNNTTPFGGFELEVEFDYTSMTFVDAEPGELIEGFELFTYRLLPCPLCACCKYKILLYGQYDVPDGVDNVGDPIPRTPMGEFQELVSLCFVVNNDENLRGLKIPVCWEWEGEVVNDTLVEDWECEENTFATWSGDTLLTSRRVCQFKADLCDVPTDRIWPLLIFQDGICGHNCGGVDVCPAGPGLCKRGDINYNTISYEVADAVLFASYFVEGTAVFRYHEAYQICATDVNADGRTLTLSDLVYLIRVILHDAVELPKLTPSSEVANVGVSDGTISTECAAPIGAILFEFDSAVSPTLLADMEMVNKENKVLVWSSKGKSFSSA
ncbi:MAG: right-handed parallel beta-helix repeat-containing protein, partial [Dehalococcoidia bacterium]